MLLQVFGGTRGLPHPPKQFSSDLEGPLAEVHKHPGPVFTVDFFFNLCVNGPPPTSPPEGQKREPDPWKLELHEAVHYLMWVQGTEPRVPLREQPVPLKARPSLQLLL